MRKAQILLVAVMNDNGRPLIPAKHRGGCPVGPLPFADFSGGPETRSRARARDYGLGIREITGRRSRRAANPRERERERESKAGGGEGREDEDEDEDEIIAGLLPRCKAAGYCGETDSPSMIVDGCPLQLISDCLSTEKLAPRLIARTRSLD
jgi:hypothetical protein